MTLPTILAAGAVILAGASAGADEPAPKAEDARAQVEPAAADSDAPLPEGFPTATRPGMIEVKSYPAYRSAVARGKDLAADAGGVLFFPLFNHISRKEIAMTAPVISTYASAEMVDDPKKRGDMTMEFLYRRPDQGETGQGVGAIRVEDHPAGRYLCLGLQGEMGPDRMKDGLAKLRAWLSEHEDQWVEAGPPRQLGYHGPMTPSARRLWEVQVPVRPAGEDPEPAGGEPRATEADDPR